MGYKDGDMVIDLDDDYVLVNGFRNKQDANKFGSELAKELKIPVGFEDRLFEVTETYIGPDDEEYIPGEEYCIHVKWPERDSVAGMKSVVDRLLGQTTLRW